MYPNIKKWIQWVEENCASPSSSTRAVAVAAVLENPYSGMDTDDLSEIIDPSFDLGEAFAGRLLHLLDGAEPLAYGKAALVGSYGEFEHGKAYLTNRFVDRIRFALDDSRSWVPSTCLRSKPGGGIDVPIAGVNDLDLVLPRNTISLSFCDNPRSSEVVVVFVVLGKCIRKENT